MLAQPTWQAAGLNIAGHIAPAGHGDVVRYAAVAGCQGKSVGILALGEIIPRRCLSDCGRLSKRAA